MKYPRFGYDKRPLSPRTSSRCLICNEQATWKWFVEYTIFRGDDEPARLCDKRECRDKLESDGFVLSPPTPEPSE